MLTLYKFGPQWNIADPSPFCVKLESFLKLNNIEYTLSNDCIRTALSKAPKGKLPFIEFENGDGMGDSTMIIEELSKRHNIDMEATLSDQQKATSHAFRRMLDESTYWVLVYSRWLDDAGWNVIGPLFFDSAPPLMRNFIKSTMRKKVRKNLSGQGFGRHSRDEVYKIGQQDLHALSTLLGDDQWFFGAKAPTLLDIWSHAYIMNLISPPFDVPIKDYALSFENLVRHAQSVQSLTYEQDIKQAA